MLTASRRSLQSLVAHGACAIGLPSQRKPVASLSAMAGCLTALSRVSMKGHPLFCTPQHSLATATAAAVATNSDGSSDAKPKRVMRKKREVLSLTKGAIDRIRELINQKDPKPYGIRLGVRTRGCNGLSYTLNYIDEPAKFDDVVEAEDVKVYIDPKAVMYLVGSRMDFVEDAVKAEFVFENPNAKGACGCGESFNV